MKIVRHQYTHITLEEFCDQHGLDLIIDELETQFCASLKAWGQPVSILDGETYYSWGAGFVQRTFPAIGFGKTELMAVEDLCETLGGRLLRIPQGDSNSGSNDLVITTPILITPPESLTTQKDN